MKLQVVTVQQRWPTPQETYYFPREFYASLKRFGCDPLVLGRGERWGGLGDNAKMMQRALNSGRIVSDYTIFTNSFDVLFRVAPEAILEAFQDLQTLNGSIPAILFGAEKVCFSDQSLAPLHPETRFTYKYLNSGWYIGETESIHDALKEMNPEETLIDDYQKPDGSWHHDNDQVAWQRQMIHGKIPIALDNQTDFVWTMHNVEEGEILWGNPPSCIETGGAPFVYHLNGNGKNRYKDRLINSLGL